MTASSPSPDFSRGEEGSAFETERVDLVRVLRDLDSLEFDCSKRTPELESFRISLRNKLPADILILHDELLAAGKRSVAPRFANMCTECSGAVVLTGSTKRLVGIFFACPHCGTLLYG
jgi:predicted  nucleic acid-binding Zn-ribbon protein